MAHRSEDRINESLDQLLGDIGAVAIELDEALHDESTGSKPSRPSASVIEEIRRYGMELRNLYAEREESCGY